MAKPKPTGIASVSALAEAMRRDHIAQVTLDPATGNVTGMVLAPSAFSLDDRRRHEREALERAKKRGKDGLPVEPNNPLREKLEKDRDRVMVDGVPIDDDDPDMYSHVEGVGDAFRSGEGQH